MSLFSQCSILASKTTSCSDEIVLLKGSPAGGVWSTQGNSVILDVNSDITKVIIKDQGINEFSYKTAECITSIQINNQGISVSLNFEQTADGEPVVDVDTAGVIHSWLWNFGDGATSTTPEPQHEFVNGIVYDVCVSVFDTISGCSDKSCHEFVFGSTDCKADFSYQVNNDQNKITLENQSTGEITDYYWTFGDGGFSTDQNPVHQYDKSNDYDICLRTYDKNTGCLSEKCSKITVGTPECDVKAEFSYLQNKNANSISFFNQSQSSSDLWFWNFGDGMSSTDKNPTHTYKNPGYYEITLSVRDTISDCFDTYSESLEIGEVSCFVDFDYSPDITSNLVTFTNKSTGNIELYYWQFGDGNSSTEIQPQHEYNKPGQYKVSLIVNNQDNSCFEKISKEIQVGNIYCNADFDCFIDSASNKVYFRNDQVSETSVVYWTFGDGTSSSVNNPVHRFPAPGYYTVQLTIFDESNDCMDFSEQVILVGSQDIDCESDFIYQVDKENNTVKFHETSIGHLEKYIWNFGDGNFSYEQNPVHQFDNKGYYDVCLSVYNLSGVSNINCKLVHIPHEEETLNCRADFDFVVDSASRSAIFTDRSVGNPATWSWNFDDGNISDLQNPKHEFISPGYYKVRLISGMEECSSLQMKLINIGMGPGLKGGFIHIEDEMLLKSGGYPTDFFSSAFGKPGRAIWDFGDGTVDSTSLNPTHVYKEPGEYTVCVTFSDSITGQSSTECNVITVTATNIEEANNGSHHFNIQPNPVNQTARIYFYLPQSSDVTIGLYDMTGRFIEEITSQIFTQGHHNIEFQRNSYPDGVYFVRLTDDKQVITRQIILSE